MHTTSVVVWEGEEGGCGEEGPAGGQEGGSKSSSSSALTAASKSSSPPTSHTERRMLPSRNGWAAKGHKAAPNSEGDAIAVSSHRLVTPSARTLAGEGWGQEGEEEEEEEKRGQEERRRKLLLAKEKRKGRRIVFHSVFVCVSRSLSLSLSRSLYQVQGNICIRC